MDRPYPSEEVRAQLEALCIAREHHDIKSLSRLCSLGEEPPRVLDADTVARIVIAAVRFGERGDRGSELTRG